MTNQQDNLKRLKQNLNVNTVPSKPPFWRRLSPVTPILVVIGVIVALVVIPGVGDTVFDAFKPPIFARTVGNETLIVIATFYETTSTPTESHTKIRRAIEEAAQKAGLTALRVEEEPTVLKADERQQAETLGNLHNASMIIWGEDTGGQLSVNLLNLKQPDLDAAEVNIHQTEGAQLANPHAYAHFIVSDLPEQITFLSFFAVGQSLGQVGNYTRAKKVIEQGIALLDADTQIASLAEAYASLGFLDLFALDDLPSAIVNYTKAIELDPKLAYVYNNRGVALKNQGNLADAIRDLNKAIELDPTYTNAYYNTAAIFARQNRIEAALPPLRRALELDTSHYYLDLIPTNLDFDPIRADPRFKALLAESE